MAEIEAFRSSLDDETLAMIDCLRGIAGSAHPALVESIKWNAPNFALGDMDCITLGVERKGGVRLVLHRGAKPRSDAGFSFEDPDGLAKWPSSDRGVMVWRDLASITRDEPKVAQLCRRWVEHISPDA